MIWLGLLVVFAGVVSYFEVFTRFPPLRDFPRANLPLVLFGVALSGLGVARAFGRSEYRGKVLGSIGLVLSLLLATLFVLYIFWFSNLPPAGETAVNLAQAPDFALTSSDGETVRLSDYRGRKVALIFYRGFW